MHQKEEREGGRWREGERKKEGRRLRHGPWSQFTLLQKSGSKSSMQGSMQSLMHPSVRPWRLSHEWDSSHVCLAFLHPHMLPQVSIRGLKSIYFPSFRVATSLKLNIQKTKIMASSPITSWQIDGETMETVTDFILGSSKITADGDCSHEIKRHLLLGRKATTNLDSILKSRDITLPTKVHLVKAIVFLVVMYGCENWTIRKLRAEELMLLKGGVGEDS